MIDLDLLDRVEQELVRVLQVLDGSAHHVAQGLWAVDLAQPLGDAGLPGPCTLSLHVVDLVREQHRGSVVGEWEHPERASRLGEDGALLLHETWQRL